MHNAKEEKDPKYSCRSILDTVPIPIFKVEKNHIITLANREAYKRWSSIVENKSFFYEVLFSMREKPEDCVIEKTFTLKTSQSAEIGTKKGEAFDMKTNYIEERNSARVVIHILDISERIRAKARLERLNRLKEDLLIPKSLEKKLKCITDGVVEIFDADFSRIWVMEPGDRCDSGCIHAEVKEGPHVCLHRDRCLHLFISSGRYTHIDGKVHSRVPFGCYKIGRVAAGEDPRFITNDVTHDRRVHDHNWAKKLGLVSFAGYRLLSEAGKPIGVLAFFSKHIIAPDENALLEGLANTTAQVIQIAKTEEALKRAKEELEMRVEDRTAELADANEDLLKEIAERKRAERELHEKEERYHALFELSPSGILLEDSEGNVIDANPAFCESLGYSKEEIIGKKVHMFTHPDVLHEVDQHIEDLLSGKVLKHAEKSIKRDGTTCYINMNEKKVTLPDGRDGIICVTEDFTERTKMEEKIKVSLKEKEILLKEIHHRVKNNLQAISSLLSLQSQYIKNEQAQEVFKNSQERIRAMALIHEKLYKSRDLSKIDLREYIRNLVLYLFDSYSLESEQVRLKMEVEDVALNIETAIPLGLIINELVSNSFKYAFPGNRKGELHVNMGKREDEEYNYDYSLIVKDNGIGFPEGLDFQNSETLGMLLVNTLVTQLHGTIELNRNEGTRFTINFNELKYKKHG